MGTVGGGDAGTLPEGSKNNYVANNIVYDNITFGIVEGGKVGGNNRYVDNLVYSSGTSVRVSGLVSGTIAADPEFVRYRPDGTGDYRLKPTSPALQTNTRSVARASTVAHSRVETPSQLGAYSLEHPTN